MDKKRKNNTPFFSLDSSIPNYSGPEPLLHTNLQPHQRKALYYMRLLESENPIPIVSNTPEEFYLHTNFGFYADPSCSGKSFVILSLLSLNKCVERKKLMTVWSNGSGMNVYSKIQNFEIPLSILVVPISSIGQWTQLLKQETNIKYYIVDEYTKIEKINTYNYDILLVADCIFEPVCIHFQGFSVSRLIFDDLYHLDITEFNKKDKTGFGDLRASFTWFVSSQPQECLQKFRYSNLPFGHLIQQIFSFPHPGLLFRNEELNIQTSLTQMLPEIHTTQIETFFPCKKLSYTFSQDDPEELVSYFVNSLEIKIKEKQEILLDLNQEMQQTFEERYEQMIDPITYDKIKYPVCLECCYQIYDLSWLCKSLYTDFRCPYCRKEFDFWKISALNHSIYMPVKKENIWTKLQNIDTNQFNIIYIPTLKIKLYRQLMSAFYKELNQRYKCMLYFGSKAYKDFQEKKGILILTRPLQSNLHLRFIDKIYVIHPKEFTIFNKIEWFSDKLVSEYGDKHRMYLSDLELGNFCIGSTKKIDFEFIRFF